MLTYHGFGDPDFMPPWLFVGSRDFDRHLAYLKAHYTPLSVGEVLIRVRAGAPLPGNGIALTIDDGYRNVYAQAAPVLLRHGFPATVFACTGPVDTRTSLWTTRVFYWCHASGADALRIGPGSELPEVRRASGEAVLPLRTGWEKVRAAQTIVDALRGYGDREGALDRVAAGLGMPRWADPFERMPMLSWSEMGELHRHGIQICSHTVSHPSLPALRRGESREELLKSKAALEAHLGQPVSVFAYPFDDRDHAVDALVREAGYRGACGGGAGVNGMRTDPYGLCRKNVESWPVELLAMELAGL